MIAFASRLPTVSTAAAVAAATAATTISAAAVAATATTISAATAVTATAATASAAAAVTATAATASAAAEAATAATAASTCFTWFSFFHNNGTTVNLAVIQLRNCFLTLFVVWHLNESIALRFASKFVGDDGGSSNLAILFEYLTQVILLRVKIQFCYENVHCKK